MTRIFSILSWVGILLLLAAVVLRLEIVKPEWAPYANYPFWAGIVLVVLYTLSQWREIAAYFSSRNARYGASVILLYLRHHPNIAVIVQLPHGAC